MWKYTYKKKKKKKKKQKRKKRVTEKEKKKQQFLYDHLRQSSPAMFAHCHKKHAKPMFLKGYKWKKNCLK